MSWGDGPTGDTFNRIFAETDSIQNEWNNRKNDWNKFFTTNAANLRQLIDLIRYPSAKYNQTITQIEANEAEIHKRQEQLQNIKQMNAVIKEKLSDTDCINSKSIPDELTAEYKACLVGKDSPDNTN